MSLWLEKRDESGNVVATGRVFDEIVYIENCGFTTEEAVQLARNSAATVANSAVPRAWTLRIIED